MVRWQQGAGFEKANAVWALVQRGQQLARPWLSIDLLQLSMWKLASSKRLAGALSQVTERLSISALLKTLVLLES